MSGLHCMVAPPSPRPPARAAARAREVHALFLFDGSLLADVKVRVFFDLGETFLCELFVNCPLNGLIDQLIPVLRP